MRAAPGQRTLSFCDDGEPCPACHAGELVMDLDDFGRCATCGANWFRARPGDVWESPAKFFNVRTATPKPRRKSPRR